MRDASSIRFAADRMLGRLAKMLRLLGYNTLYSAQMTTSQLREITRQGDRIVLTRGDAGKRFPEVQNVVSLKSEYAPEQLRELIERFNLDPHGGLWTRCTLCNAMIESVDKQAVRHLVEAKVFDLYNEFFRCSGCGQVYWRGSHVERVLRNLNSILGKPGT